MDLRSERIAARLGRPPTTRDQSQPGRLRQAAVERWENEGGTVLVGRRLAPLATRRSSSREADALETAVRDMADSLFEGFAEGRVGTRYNSLDHRSRVLRQLTAKLALMRQRDVGATI